MIKWRKQYADPKNDELLGQVTAIDTSIYPDKTVQSYKEDADINTLVKRFGVTGEMERSSVAPFYGDFSEATDYQTSLDMIREAEAAFERLPSGVRSKFANNPAELITFLQNADNRREAEELGLVPKTPPVEPMRVHGGSEGGGGTT